MQEWLRLCIPPSYWLFVSTLGAVTRCSITVMSGGGNQGFHLGANAAARAYGENVSFFLRRCGAESECVSKSQSRTCLCVFLTAGWSSRLPLRRHDDALSLDIGWHVLKTSPLPFLFFLLLFFLKASPGSLPSMDPFPSSILRAPLHSCDP